MGQNSTTLGGASFVPSPDKTPERTEVGFGQFWVMSQRRTKPHNPRGSGFCPNPIGWMDVLMGTTATSPWKRTATADRIDWDDVKDRVDLAGIATGLLGPALKRSGRRLLWRCP